MTHPAPVLSIVVIGRNEGERLAACLKSIRAARMPGPVELIYVDSGSADESAGLAATFGAEVIVLESGRMSAARARNAGWRSAKSPFILFLDGDTILDPDFVDISLKAFDDPGVAVVWGQRREMRPEASIYNRICDLDWIARPGYSDFCGGDSIMRREVLERTNGFNPDLIAGEEPDLCRRIRGLGGKILHLAIPMTRHDLAFVHFSQYWRRAVRTGHAYAEIAGRYRDTRDPLWTRESRHNFRHGFLYLAVLAGAVIVAEMRHTLVPVLLLAVAGAALALRTAFHSRWKAPSWPTLVLFGIHSHVQHVPVLQGQLLYLWARWRGQRRELIEYKSS
ncbi:MAG TPA: glycosyltransferase [Bryobacteraceae bacterium]|jgi:glycosyltransferase involved in cell wall biosynthesis|nr:glycosyltransferase [Bryobacteraceae bacterium]